MNINDILVKIIIFIIIILLGLVVSKVVSNLIRKLIKEFEITKILKKTDINFNPNNFIPDLCKYLILLRTIIIALNSVGITSLALRIISVILILVIIAYILISIKDLMPNIYHSFKIKKKYKLGDKIKNKNIEGKILYMNLVELQIKTKDKIIYIPYKLLK